MAKKKAAKKRTARSGTCAAGVCNPPRTQGLKAPAPQGKHTLVSLDGPGVFVGAHVSKQGGGSGLTFVNLDVDGRNVTAISYAAAKNLGFTQQNPYGLVLLGSASIRNLTIGFPTPLSFTRSLVLSVDVQEEGVVQILGNVIHGSL